MNGQSRLGVIALAISILVILGLVIVFCFLFFLYSFYKKKQIKYGFEDKELNDEITSTLYKTNKKNLSRNKNLITYKDVIVREKSITSKLHIVMDVVSGVIIAFLLAIFITGLTYRINNDNLFIGNTTYMTILTSSMEEKNEDNDYLLTYDLNDQITQYSLIGIDKINSEDDIELYDILAYKHDDIVIVHRVVEIKDILLPNKTDKKSVKFIWYEPSDNANAIEIFTRINIGKIPLTNSELIKALFLQKANFKYDDKKYNDKKDNDKKDNDKFDKDLYEHTQIEIASEWDYIENTLQNNRFWGFINNDINQKYNRIDYIFEIVSDKEISEEDKKEIGADKYKTFRYFYKKWKNNEDKMSFMKDTWKEIRYCFYANFNFNWKFEFSIRS